MHTHTHTHTYTHTHLLLVDGRLGERIGEGWMLLVGEWLCDVGTGGGRGGESWVIPR